MDLDDLKKTWQQESTKQPQTQNIMELIHQKSKGPLALLKKSFRRQMTTISILMMVIIITNAWQLETIPGNVLFWTYLAFCLAVIFGFYRNYRLTKKMESMDGQVKANLEEYVMLLQKRLKWQSAGAKVVILVFILLLEVLPLLYHARMLDKWHSVSPLIRFSSYGVYLVIVHFVGRAIMQRKFGQHIAHLKELLKELK
jgi:hypothetical protein